MNIEGQPERCHVVPVTVRSTCRFGAQSQGIEDIRVNQKTGWIGAMIFIHASNSFIVDINGYGDGWIAMNLANLPEVGRLSHRTRVRGCPSPSTLLA